MTTLRYGDAAIELESGESALEALLRHGFDVPSSCRNGVCQSCMMRCEKGNPGSVAQRGLKETLSARGYFLACQCTPTDDIEVSMGETSALFTEARLTSRTFLAPAIARLCFETAAPVDFEPGQFVHLRRPDGLLRSYSVASGPGDPGIIELHVGRVENGRMSSWLLDDLAVGATVDMRGPSGDCFYVAGRPEQPLLLIGTGTGLAPLLGILRAALAAGHSGDIHLYHGSYEPSGLYLVQELRTLAAEHGQFHYHPCVDTNAEDGFVLGRASDIALAEHQKLAGWRVMLCGHAAMVKQTRKLAYLAGANLADILADPFEISRS